MGNGAFKCVHARQEHKGLGEGGGVLCVVLSAFEFRKSYTSEKGRECSDYTYRTEF